MVEEVKCYNEDTGVLSNCEEAPAPKIIQSLSQNTQVQDLDRVPRNVQNSTIAPLSIHYDEDELSSLPPAI